MQREVSAVAMLVSAGDSQLVIGPLLPKAIALDLYYEKLEQAFSQFLLPFASGRDLSNACLAMLILATAGEKKTAIGKLTLNHPLCLP